MTMIAVRKEVESLGALGHLPSEDGAVPETILKFEKLLMAITKPITDDEARVLVGLFGADGCFGLASLMVQLIETAPGWPLADCLVDPGNEWVGELRKRAVRGGYSFE